MGYCWTSRPYSPTLIQHWINIACLPDDQWSLWRLWRHLTPWQQIFLKVSAVSPVIDLSRKQTSRVNTFVISPVNTKHFYNQCWTNAEEAGPTLYKCCWEDCFYRMFLHLKLELFTQFPASDEKHI